MTEIQIIGYNHRRKSVYLRLTPTLMSAVLLSLCSFFLLVFNLGSEYGAKEYASTIFPQLKKEIQLQQHTLSKAKANASKSLDILSERISGMESQLQRLNTIGQGLLISYELADFDFNIHPVPESNDYSYDNVQPFITKLNQLSHIIEDRMEKFSVLEDLIIKYGISKTMQPSIKPVHANISSLFGWRLDPLNPIRRVFHEGIDFAGKTGSKIKSVASGIVTWSAPLDNYGNVVEIVHGYGVTTRYAHNKENLVAVGDKVTKGQVIATMGASGRATGPHLHFELLKHGKHIDPIDLVKLN